MNFERARSDNQKKIRMNQITDSARQLFENTKYENITLASIARELSFTRANLYKYVTSKEEIFLYILIEDITKWNNSIVKKFDGINKISIEDFAAIWTQSFMENRHMIKTMSIMYSVIERNVTVEKLVEFKTRFFKELQKSIDVLKILFPEFNTHQIYKFLEMQMFYAIGLYPATIENAVQKQAIEKVQVAYSPPDFAEWFSEFIIMVLKSFKSI